jgi:hypothetical protein
MLRRAGRLGKCASALIGLPYFCWFIYVTMLQGWGFFGCRSKARCWCFGLVQCGEGELDGFENEDDGICLV